MRTRWAIWSGALMLVVAAGVPACGDDDDGGQGGSPIPAACRSCAELSCPDEYAACGAAEGCEELMECAYPCGTDNACQVACAAQSPSTTAINAGQDLLDCASAACEAECPL
ncbi:MAG TPA: hypothetical protein VKZ49_19500 [Polyangiaceae bacterium]|nr:hypothetical protein [Polyangiaceae bacterium]